MGKPPYAPRTVGSEQPTTPPAPLVQRREQHPSKKPFGEPITSDIAEYTDQLLAIHGIDADDQPLGDEITELAGHAYRLGIPNHFLDLFVWTQNIHWAVGCSSAEDHCACFFRSTAS